MAACKVALLGAVIEHGGKIIKAASTLKKDAIPVARDRHKVEGPKCGAIFALMTTGELTRRPTKVAYVGNKPRCSAAVIAS